MHPYGPGHFWYRSGCYGPSRILWFAFGAIAASLWTRHQGRVEWHSHSNCVRPPVLSTQAEPVDPWSAHGVSRAVNGIAPETMSSDDKRRLAELGTSAGDKLVELSEATLDTVLTTVEVLKAKLAEHRAEREKQQEEERRRKESPPRIL
ncbi:hypothetical protein J132_06517 [Termitomyces sp. J132]|nr:hypothetical protein J132_06517 [Termitomyces sp. J132]